MPLQAGLGRRGALDTSVVRVPFSERVLALSFREGRPAVKRSALTVVTLLFCVLAACSPALPPTQAPAGGSAGSTPPAGAATAASARTGVPAGSEIVLGMFAPLTGPLAATGVPARDGFQVWVDEVNAAGGISGRRVRLIAYDDANSPQEAVAATRRLIDQDGVFALVCGSNSGATLATLDLVRSAGVPFVTCISAHRD